jgi:hypothetical protein
MRADRLVFDAANPATFIVPAADPVVTDVVAAP